MELFHHHGYRLKHYYRSRHWVLSGHVPKHITRRVLYQGKVTKNVIGHLAHIIDDEFAQLNCS